VIVNSTEEDSGIWKNVEFSNVALIISALFSLHILASGELLVYIYIIQKETPCSLFSVE